jgi:transcriptional regulator with XRE-family HTH domain
MYSIFEQLMKNMGISTYKVAKDTGIAQSVFSSWKNGISTPKSDKLQIIADYFNVSLEYLMTGKEIDSTEFKYYLSEETAETAQEIFDNDRILFDVYKSSQKERLIAYAKKLEELRKMEEGDI